MDDLELRLRFRKIEGRILILSAFVAFGNLLWVFLIVPMPAGYRVVLLAIPLLLAVLGMIRANPGPKEKQHIRRTGEDNC